MSIPVDAQIDTETVAAAAAQVREMFADAIRGALADVILGPDVGEEPQPELSDSEASLLDQYRRSSEPNRAAAHRTLELGIPQEDR